MNKEEALSLFCRQNIKLLTSEDLPRLLLKQSVREYFYDKHKNAYGQPGLREIQFALLDLLRSNGLASERIAALLDTAGLFLDISQATRAELLERSRRDSPSSALTDQELGDIKAVGAYRALEKSKGQEIELQKLKALEAIDAQIETKRQEYESLPSVLDESPVQEPEFDPKTEDVKPWWERFYLKADPFPRKDGLSAIHHELYDVVTSKTKPFTEVLSALRRDANHLFHKGFLLAGGYGYGKTTFIDYISYHLIHTDVLPVRITCTRCSSDASGFADSFFHRLRKELIDESNMITRVDHTALADLEIEDQVIELAKVITSRKRGVVIFLDDYHKYASHFPQIFEFLGTLQVLKDSLTRKGIPVGFIVSGLDDWKLELHRNSQLSGFLDNPPIEMPTVEAELVCEVFNNRIKAYCFESTPRRVKIDFVQHLVKEFAGRAGFRDYITKIISELSNNNDAIVNSPIEIEDSTLEAIKAILETEPLLKSSISKLVFGSLFKRFNREQVAKTLQLLVHIGMHGGISEADKEFLANRFYFQTLKDCGLIQKQRSVGPTKLAWGLNLKLRKCAESVSQRFGLSMSDYLLKIYAYKDYSTATRRDSGDEGQLGTFKKFLAKPELRLDKSVADNLALGIRLFEAADSSPRATPEDLEKMHSSVVAFSAAQFAIDTAQIYFRRAGIQHISAQWEMHPLREELLSEAFARHRDYSREKTPSNLALALKQMREAATLLMEIVEDALRKETTVGEPSVLHRPLSHTDEEIALFTSVEEGWYSTRGEDHFDYVRRVTDWLELRLRTFLYFTGNLLFGENYLEQCPAAIVGYAYKNLETRVSYGSYDNRLDGLTRSQYRQIICDGNGFKQYVLVNLPLEWKREDWDLFARMFAEINIDAAHLQVAAYDPSQRKRYLKYCYMAEELTAAMNRLVAEVLDCSVYLCRMGGDKVDEYLFKCDFRKGVKIKDDSGKRILSEWPDQLKSNKAIVDHTLDTEGLAKVRQRIVDKVDNSPDGMLVLDLLQIEYLCDHYRVSAVQLVNALAYLKYVDRTFDVFPWFSSSIAVRKAGARVSS